MKLGQLIVTIVGMTIVVGCTSQIVWTFFQERFQPVPPPRYTPPKLMGLQSMNGNTTNTSQTVMDRPKIKSNKTYIVLDYDGYCQFEKKDYFIGNCLVTRDAKRIHQAHAVVITSRKFKALPKIRHSWQRWVWVMDESPYHLFIDKPAIFDHVFNWTMTYRHESDVHIPMGRTVPKTTENTTRHPDHTANLGNRAKKVISLISNCGPYVHNHRMDYVQRLNKAIGVDVFGRCGKKGLCPGWDHWISIDACPVIEMYMFVLSFENSNCREYITEKLFSNGFHMGAVPVVMGPPKEDYLRLAPPNSFIHTRDFASPEKLAEYLKYLSRNQTEYMKFHEWRKHYEVKVRNIYIHRSVWIPLCEKLNTDTGEPKSIPSIGDFWSMQKDCDGTKYW